MRVCLVCCVLLVLVGFAVSAETPSAPRPIPGDAQDLVLFLDARPCLIRLHLQINGRSFRKNWDETIAHLFHFLDTDRNGTLDKKEAVLTPSRTQCVQLMTAVPVEPDSAPEFAELAGGSKDTTVTRERFSAYYNDSGAGALQIEWGWRPPSQDLLSDAVIKQLDKDKDGVLSRDELSNAYAALQALDINGDDLIQSTELSAGAGYPAFTYRATTEEQPVPKAFPFAIVSASGSVDSPAGALLAHYDHDKDRKLSRKEWPLEKSLFDALDRNRDGCLESKELAEWRKTPPELELLLPLGENARKDILVMPTADGKLNRLAARMSPSRDGALRIPIAEKQIEVVKTNSVNALREELLKQFDKQAGKGGLLGEKSIYQPPFQFVALLRLADRNGDNQLSRTELKDYLDLQEKMLFRNSYLTVVDRGPSLFDFLDADHDGRLSQRELRSAWTRLAPWSTEGGTRIALKQVPRQFQFVLSYGKSRAALPVSGMGSFDVPLFRDAKRGPLWFRKMDRNSDGDVSQTEFLGTVEQFRLMDADGDGLIDVSEAERADQTLRKRP